MLGKLLIFNLISFNTVCNTNTTTNANEIKALTRIESEKTPNYFCSKSMKMCYDKKCANLFRRNISDTLSFVPFTNEDKLLWFWMSKQFVKTYIWLASQDFIIHFSFYL